MLRGGGAEAEVSTKTGGSGMVLAREGAGGCESGVVRGRSPIFARYLFTAVRAALVIVYTSWCVVGGEKSSFRVVGGHDTCVSNAGVRVGSERGGGGPVYGTSSRYSRGGRWVGAIVRIGGVIKTRYLP